MKKSILIFTLLLFPFNIFAYSSEVYVGGNTIGIDIKTDGILISGFYKIDGNYNMPKETLKVGDYITHINNEKVTDIISMSDIINKYKNNKYITLTIKRNNKVFKTNLDIIYSNGNYKTGLYVKDSITGIGTITYIDPETMIYGALGHEIIESNNENILKIKGGFIFENSITSIKKSNAGIAGSKNAKYNYQNKYGTIRENTTAGIYGKTYKAFNDNNLMKVASIDEIKIGKAEIYTVLNNQEIEKFNIEITAINEDSNIKNLSIKITDKNLLNKTGGVVQGMSGSPIIQNNKIIGAVTHVVVDKPDTGYGIFITTMLEEGEN